MEKELILTQLEKSYQSYLRTETRLVGVGLFKSAVAYEQSSLKVHKGRAFYCQMIKKATEGRAVKAASEHFSCDTAARILGLRPYYDEEEGIDGWHESGLYADRHIAEKQHDEVRPVDFKTAGVAIGPIGELTVEPDIILIACNPTQAMRLVQGYTYSHGFKTDFKISGQCGVCFESTALPLSQRDFTVSLLCSGTRFMCQWPDDTMMVAFPYEMAQSILDGLGMTAERVESNAVKEEVKENLSKYDLEEKAGLNIDTAYYYRRS